MSIQGIEVKRILKENLKNFINDVKDKLVLSFTEEDELYINDKNGDQHKITDVIFFEEEIDIDYSKLKQNKLYVIKDPFGIYYKNPLYDPQEEGSKILIDVLEKVKDNTNNNSISIDEIKELIEGIQNGITEKEERERTKNFKVNMPVPIITLGSKSALNLSSLIFYPTQSLVFKSISVTGRNFTPASMAKISITLDLGTKGTIPFEVTLTEADNVVKLPVGADLITEGFVNVDVVETREVEGASLDFVYEIDRINEEIITDAPTTK